MVDHVFLQSAFQCAHDLFVQLTNCWNLLVQAVIPLAVIEIAMLPTGLMVVA